MGLAEKECLRLRQWDKGEWSASEEMHGSAVSEPILLTAYVLD